MGKLKSRNNTDNELKLQSLGCTLFAVAYGHSPFETEGSSVGMAVMSGRYRHPANNGGYSDKIKQLIDSLLVVDPESRPDIDAVSSESLDSNPRYRGIHADF